LSMPNIVRPRLAVKLALTAFAGATIAAIVLAAQQSSPRTARATVTVRATRALLGTIVGVTVVAEDEQAAEEHLSAAFTRAAALEATLAAQQTNTELAQLNRAAGGEAVKIADDLYRAIAAGVEWHKRSRGCFDITAGPLISLWMDSGKSGRLPTKREITQAYSLVGANRVILDKQAQTAQLPIKGMRLHLGGLGKGYCARAVTRLLKQRGVTSALVAMSGDIYALGTRADGSPWRIGVQDPRRPRDPSRLITVLELTDKAVSTSGNYERYVEINGKKYSHIVDPRTGRTVDNVPSVTVIGPDPLVNESAFTIKDGHVEPPHGPGFGITIDEKRLEKFTLLQETIT